MRHTTPRCGPDPRIDSIFIAFCCACANGYDGSLMTAILAMPHFQKVFGAGANLNTSVIFSIYTV